MKKTILSIILILAAAGTAFYFGLVSRMIPNDSLGVIFTKTGGWNSSPVNPGQLRWVPEALLPTNMTLHIVPDKTYSYSLEIDGVLPNSAAYLEYLEQNADFSWSLSASLSVKYTPENLPELFAETGLRPEQMEQRLNSDIENLKGIIETIYTERFSSTDELFTPPSMNEIPDEIREAVRTHFPYLSVISLSVTGASFPDFDLYFRAREHYLAVLSNQTDKLITDIQVSAEEKSMQTIKLEILKRYGELFNQYPRLIDFLAIDSPNVNKLLPEEWN